MRFLFLISALLIFICVINSCQKDLPYHLDENGNVVGDSLDTAGTDSDVVISNSEFTKMVQGTGVGDDTVYYVTYDSAHLIHTITDSAYATTDSMIATYDSASYLQKIRNYQAGISTGYEDYFYTYDSSKRLTEINYRFSGQPNKVVFEYNDSTSKIPVKKYYYNGEINGNTTSLYRTYSFESSNGDITKITAFTPDGTQDGDPVVYTYSSASNVFKNLALFNLGNYLGFEEIVNEESYFNKHLVKSYTIGSEVIDNTYLFNSKNKITSAVSFFPSDSSAFTRKFYY